MEEEENVDLMPLVASPETRIVDVTIYELKSIVQYSHSKGEFVFPPRDCIVRQVRFIGKICKKTSLSLEWNDSTGTLSSNVLSPSHDLVGYYEVIGIPRFSPFSKDEIELELLKVQKVVDFNALSHWMLSVIHTNLILTKSPVVTPTITAERTSQLRHLLEEKQKMSEKSGVARAQHKERIQLESNIPRPSVVPRKKRKKRRKKTTAAKRFADSQMAV